MIRIEPLPADILGLSPLERAALSGQLKQRAVATSARDVLPIKNPFSPAQRAQLSRWMEACATAHAPHVAVLESIRHLANPTTACVVFEAMPGILTGPSEQLFGVLQTIALAKKLTSAERVVTPIVWVLSDEPYDTPLITSRILNRHHDLQTLQLDEVAAGRKSAHMIELEDARHGTGALRAVLSQLYGDLPQVDEALETLVPRPGESLAGAFTRALYSLFGAQGIVVMQPQEFREELIRSSASCLTKEAASLLRESAAELEQTYAANIDEEQPWFYRIDAHGRHALHAESDCFRFLDEPGSRTTTELAAELVQSPREWQAGHWFQSLSRAALLPVLAEVGGAHELERHLLLHPLRVQSQWPCPAFVPQVRVSIIDAGTRESLQRLGLNITDVLRTRGRVPTSQDPDGAETNGVLQAIEQIKQDTRTSLSQQKRPLADLDPRLSSALRYASREISQAFDKLGQKIEHLQADEGGKFRRHERRLWNGLFPDGQPQGALLPPFYWLASHGGSWLTELLGEIDAFSPEHLAVHLD